MIPFLDRLKFNKAHIRRMLPLAGLVAVGLFLGFLPVQRAQACRDCPFPMRVSDGRYLMPNGQMYIMIDETAVFGGRYRQVRVSLIAALTGETLADGWALVHPYRHVAHLKLQGQKGDQIDVTIYWIDRHREDIRVRLTCSDCSIAQLLN
jgi:hypothetical protein